MTSSIRRRLLTTAAAFGAAGMAQVGSAPIAVAQAVDDGFPNRPVTIIVGYSPGGANDVLARIMAERLTTELGQSVVVENRPGVASILGAQVVAKARPDGYTLLMGASGPIVFNHALYQRLPYGPADLVPISLVGTFPLVLLTRADHPARSVIDLVDASKREPDKANYASSSTSFQLVTELFNEKTGARFMHVPYKGSNDSVTAVIAGDVTMTLVDSGPASTALQGKRVKALAVTADRRLAAMPDVPTMKELGIDLTVTFWSGLLAPAGTPPAVIDRLNRAIVTVGSRPDVKARISALSIEPVTSTPAAFGERIAAEIPVWRDVARQKNIRAD